MNQKFKLLAISVVTAAISLPALAQTEPTTMAPVVVEQTKVVVGAETQVDPMIFMEIKNFQDETLGRIKELSIDLTSGRIVEVLVISDSSLDVDNKIVAIPPSALFADAFNRAYRVQMSAAQFKTAPAIDLSEWMDDKQTDRVAAAYRFFSQPVFFLESGQTANKKDERPKASLGFVQRSSKVLDLPISNHQDERLGKVWSLSLDIPSARILSVVVLAAGGGRMKNVVPAMALSFNAARDGLLLNETSEELENEPHYIYTAAAYGQEARAREEHYTGERTDVALVQGSSYRDVDQTVRINKEIRSTGIDCRNVEVGTINDRVTLRGTVGTAEDRRKVGNAAILVSRVELVDNQITVAGAVNGG